MPMGRGCRQSVSFITPDSYNAHPLSPNHSIANAIRSPISTHQIRVALRFPFVQLSKLWLCDSRRHFELLAVHVLRAARCVEVRLYPVSDASDRRRYECDSHDDNGDSDVPQRHCYWSCDGSSAVVRTVRRKSPKQTRRTTTEPATGRSSNVPS